MGFFQRLKQGLSKTRGGLTDRVDSLVQSTEKIDGIVAWIMGLDRAIRQEQQGSVYDNPDHGLWVF